jgi:hypothetical protein
VEAVPTFGFGLVQGRFDALDQGLLAFLRVPLSEADADRLGGRLVVAKLVGRAQLTRPCAGGVLQEDIPGRVADTLQRTAGGGLGVAWPGRVRDEQVPTRITSGSGTVGHP